MFWPPNNTLPRRRSFGGPAKPRVRAIIILILALFLIGCGGGGTSSAPPPPSNPVPTLTSISPASATAGGAAFTLTATGRNFISSSVVRWNGSNRTTTVVSTTQLRAAIPASDVAAGGTVDVTVFNPAPGGGVSRFLTFTIALPSPLVLTTTSLPDSASGKNYYFIPAAIGGVPPPTWSLASGTSLPTGLRLDPTTGLISGTLGTVGADTTFNFTLQVADSASVPQVVTRDLSITVHPGGLGSNNVCTGGTTAGTTQISNGRLRASISPYGDIDVYSFHGTQGSPVTIETFAQRLDLDGDANNRDSYLDTVLELLDDNCSQIASNDDMSPPPNHIQDSLIENFTLPYTGLYFIRARDFRGDGRPDLVYELSLSGAD